MGGILRNTEVAPGFTAPGIAHTVGRLRASVVKDLKLNAHGYDAHLARPCGCSPRSRTAAPSRSGARPRARRTELRQRNPKDADAYLLFDKKVRSFASFLAHVNVVTPPDPKTPSLADAFMGLKLGKAFRDLGAKTGRETIRALPMAVADLVQETFEDEAIRGPLATRGVLYTSMGAWATGTAAVFLNDSAGNDGGAPGTAVFAKGGTGALARRARVGGSLAGRRDPHGRPR